MSQTVTVEKKKTGGSLYWHEYKVKANKKNNTGKNITAMSFSTMSPDFEEEWGGFLMLMDSLKVKVEVVEA